MKITEQNPKLEEDAITDMEMDGVGFKQTTTS